MLCQRAAEWALPLSHALLPALYPPRHTAHWAQPSAHPQPPTQPTHTRALQAGRSTGKKPAARRRSGEAQHTAAELQLAGLLQLLHLLGNEEAAGAGQVGRVSWGVGVYNCVRNGLLSWGPDFKHGSVAATICVRSHTMAHTHRPYSACLLSQPADAPPLCAPLGSRMVLPQSLRRLPHWLRSWWPRRWMPCMTSESKYAFGCCGRSNVGAMW